MKHTIEVTQRDIEKGKPGEYCLCPIARAVRRKLHKATKDVRVDSKVYLYRDNREKRASKRIKLSQKAINFITKFDNVKTQSQVKPFTFVLDTDKEVL